MSELKVFSTRLRQLRTLLNMTQKDFAKHVGITQQTMSGYETGRVKPALDITVDIATKCGISLDWLCGLSENKVSNEQLLTYKDLFVLLVKLCDSPATKKTWTIFTQNSDMDPEYTSVSTYDAIVFNFVKDWVKMRDILNDGLIDRTLYDSWLSDRLNRYKDERIPDYITDSKGNDLPFV